MNDVARPWDHKPEESKGINWTAIAAIALIGFCALGVFFSSDSDSSGNGSEDRTGYARVACEDYVKDHLMSPSSADFSGQSESNVGDEWTASGSVDSENSFGASIRNNYTCTMTDNGDSFTITDLSGLDN